MLKAIENILAGSFDVEEFLLVSILGFVSLFVFLLFILYAIRGFRIWKENKKAKLLPFVEKKIIGYLFEDLSLDSSDPIWKKTYFKEQMLVAVVNLHKQYSGAYAQKLEQAYLKYGLYKISLKKLDSMNWSAKCEAIRELSEMKYLDAFPYLEALAHASRHTLRIEAMTGMIRMKGVEALSSLAEFKGYLHDWAIANILHTLKEQKGVSFEQVKFLLESENPSLIKLGLILCHSFDLPLHQELLMQISNTENQGLIDQFVQKYIPNVSI